MRARDIKRLQGGEASQRCQIADLRVRDIKHLQSRQACQRRKVGDLRVRDTSFCRAVRPASGARSLTCVRRDIKRQQSRQASQRRQGPSKALHYYLRYFALAALLPLSTVPFGESSSQDNDSSQTSSPTSAGISVSPQLAEVKKDRPRECLFSAMSFFARSGTESSPEDLALLRRVGIISHRL